MGKEQKDQKQPLSTLPFPFASKADQEEERWQMYVSGSLDKPPEPLNDQQVENNDQS